MIWGLLLGAVPLDPVGAPLPLYLDESAIRGELARLPDLLSTCDFSVDRTFRLTLAFAGDGTAKVTALDGAEEGLSVCIQAAIVEGLGRPHRGIDVVVKTVLYTRGGEWLVSPSPTLVPQPSSPPMLFSGDDEALQRTLWRHLSGPGNDER